MAYEAESYAARRVVSSDVYPGKLDFPPAAARDR